MVDTPIGVSQIDPADSQRTVLPLGISQDSSKLHVMFRAAWCCWHERFLDGLVKVFVGEHEVKQPVPNDGGKELTNT